MKKLFTTTLFLISTLSFCQLKSVIINSKTKEKIPYVNIWIKNKNIGTTSNEKGELKLKTDNSKIIIFSAIGFETKKIPSDSIKNIVQLKPVMTELDEVIIKSKRSTKKQ